MEAVNSYYFLVLHFTDFAELFPAALVRIHDYCHSWLLWDAYTPYADVYSLQPWNFGILWQ